MELCTQTSVPAGQTRCFLGEIIWVKQNHYKFCDTKKERKKRRLFLIKYLSLSQRCCWKHQAEHSLDYWKSWLLEAEKHVQYSLTRCLILFHSVYVFSLRETNCTAFIFLILRNFLRQEITSTFSHKIFCILRGTSLVESKSSPAKAFSHYSLISMFSAITEMHNKPFLIQRGLLLWCSEWRSCSSKSSSHPADQQVQLY